jgi:hypothetical protein
LAGIAAAGLAALSFGREIHEVGGRKEEQRHTAALQPRELRPAEPVQVVGDEGGVHTSCLKAVEQLPGRETPLRHGELPRLVQRGQ